MKSKQIVFILYRCLIFSCFCLMTLLADQSWPGSFLRLGFSVINIGIVADAAELTADCRNGSRADRLEKCQNSITVYAAHEIGPVNRKIFGSHLLGYPLTVSKEFVRFPQQLFVNSNYGTGIWNPVKKKAEAEVVGLAVDAGMSVLRFPGGTYADSYNWKKSIGSRKNNFLFGVDEFLQVCNDVGAEAVYTVNFLSGNDVDAADLIEYLNIPDDGTNPNGGKDWAKERAKNGHPEPFHVRYFEIGNEVWDRISYDRYAEGYLKFYESMKNVDPNIKIGAVLFNDTWNFNLMKKIKANIDFGIIHTYPSPNGYKMFRKKSREINTTEIFKKVLSLPQIRDEWHFRNTLKIMKTCTGRRVPLAITEHNGGFVQDKPIPLRHTLGTALINADLLHLFLKPENGILLANYHQFCNGYWGMIRANTHFLTKYSGKPVWYLKRPNYFVYQLYHKHFGNTLLHHELTSDSYDISRYPDLLEKVITIYQVGTGTGQNLLAKSWTIKKLDGVETVVKDAVLKVDFKFPKQFNYYHAYRSVKVLPQRYYKVSGYIKTENLEDPIGVCLAAQWGPDGVATNTVRGTTGWVYCARVFQTPADVHKVSVLARRIGKKGPLKGRARFKNVRLEEFIPSIDTNIPYLSVNTSKSSDGKTVYVMAINKSLEQDMDVKVVLLDFVPSGLAHIYSLWAEQIDATNDYRPNNRVRVHQAKISFQGNNFDIRLKRHSLTAIEIVGNLSLKR